jgi:lipopolysaccharide biosynthesis glycosyltransferase
LILAPNSSSDRLLPGAPITVVSCVDANFLPYVGPVATSIARSASRPIDYTVFYDGPESDDAKALDGFVAGPVRVTLRRAPDWIERYGEVDGYPAVALLRLRLHDEMPGVNEVIYLDADVLVLRDIAELADMELGDAPIAAAADRAYELAELAAPRPGSVARPYDAQRCIAAMTGLANSGPGVYVNSGVMRMNLDALRREDFGARSAAILDRWNKFLRFRDQDVFNIAFGSRIGRLEPTWNSLVGVMLQRRDHLAPDLRAELEAERRRPAIVHFAGVRKPWLRRKLLPFAGVWWHFARLSPTAATIERRYRARMAAEDGAPYLARWLATTLAGRRYATIARRASI